MGWEMLLEDSKLVLKQQSEHSDRKKILFAKLTGVFKAFEKYRWVQVPSQCEKKFIENIIFRGGTLVLSNFLAISEEVAMTYDTPSQDQLCEITGYKPGFFQNIGCASFSLALLDPPKIPYLIGLIQAGGFDPTKQRAFKQSCYDELVENLETYK